jgi:Ner family transcriptional regulator
MSRVKGWHKEDIKAAIRKRGTTLVELSLANGLVRDACSLALIRPYFTAEMVIAEFLRVSPRQIWPQRYNEDGSAKHAGSQRNYMRRQSERARQIGEAA